MISAAKPEPRKDLFWPDERLVRECIKGNEQAWAALIDKYKNLIFSIPIKHELSRDDASDIFQAVCMDLLAELPRLREPRALPKWLMQVTSHKCFHWKQREHRYISGEEGESAIGPASLAGVDEVIAAVQQEQILREAVSSLQPRCAEMIHMLFFENPARPYQEIAKRLGIATGSIGFIRARCLDGLRKKLQTLGFQ